jgi:hypothetical protein
MPDLLENAGQCVVRIQEIQADVGVAGGEFLGEGVGDDVVAEAVEDEGGLGKVRKVLVVSGVLDHRVTEVPQGAVGVMEDGEAAGAAPFLHTFRSQISGPAGGEAEGGSEEDEAADVGVAGGVEGGEISAKAGADEDGFFSGDFAFHDGELAREGEVFKVAFGEIGHLEREVQAPEPIEEEFRFFRGGAAGESVQIDVTHQ